MKLAIIYHSVSGNTAKAAEYVKMGMEKIEGVTAVTMNVSDVTAEDIKDVCGIVFGAPTYYAHLSWQMLQFMESNIPLADKLGGAFATANCSQGGSEIVLQSLTMLMLAKGMTVYSGGTGHGTPFTHIGVNAFAKEPSIEEREELLMAFGERFAAKAKEYFE